MKAKIAGILCVFQNFLTKYGGKDAAKIGAAICSEVPYTNPYLKTPTERRGFFASGEENGAGNTVCIVKPFDDAWRKKDRRELEVLIRD